MHMKGAEKYMKLSKITISEILFPSYHHYMQTKYYKCFIAEIQNVPFFYEYIKKDKTFSLKINREISTFHREMTTKLGNESRLEKRERKF